MMGETSQSVNKPLKKAAVIGCPIAHSQSPIMHNYCLTQLGIHAHYSAVEIKSENELGQFLNAIRGDHWVGINVTLPYKESVLQYLDDASEDVQAIGACNTIVNHNGRLLGYNTDARGFSFPLKNHRFESVLVLGNGGASKAVVYECCRKGATSIDLVARNHDKSMDLVRRMEDSFQVSIHCREFQDVTPHEMERFELVVNTTSVGLQPTDPVFDCIRWLDNSSIFYDLIYSPWQTKMMEIAMDNGGKCINGAPMLAHQGALAFELFFGKCVDTQWMLRQLVP